MSKLRLHFYFIGQISIIFTSGVIKLTHAVFVVWYIRQDKTIGLYECSITLLIGSGKHVLKKKKKKKKKKNKKKITV